MKTKFFRLFKQTMLVIWPLLNITSVFLGFIFIFTPRITGWLEIFQPLLADSFILLMFLWRKLWIPLFILVPVGYLIHLLISAKRRYFKLFQTIIICAYIAIWQFEYPSGVTANQRRISSYRFAGQARMVRAGGVEQVRTESLAYARTSSEVYPPKEEWPQTLQQLGDISLKISEDKKTVYIALPQYWRYMRRFQYIIQEKETDTPTVESNHRIWLLDDGVYLVWILD